MATREPRHGLQGLPPEADASQPQRGVSLRAVIIGLLLIPPNAYWVIYVEGIRHWNHVTAMSLFWNTIFCLMVLVLGNLVVKRYAPKLALRQGEFITIYVMLTLMTALAGHDSLQLSYPSTYMPFLYENMMEGRVNPAELGWFPRHLTVQDPEVIASLETGGDTLYRARYLSAWIGPVLWWCSFIAALGLVMICINVLIRKQWTENEKLSFPIVQLPLAMTHEGGTVAFFMYKPLLMGLLIGASINILNGLHFYYPIVPGFPVRHNSPELRIGDKFTTHPWNAIPNNLGMPLYPFIIAIGYFLPLDLSFSIWFFFIIKLLMRVGSAALGYEVGQPHNPPYQSEQSFGAWFAIFAVAMYISRDHLKTVLKSALGMGRRVDDSQEPMRYRTAFWGMMGGGAFVYYFCLRAGMTAGIIFLFFLIYFVLSVAITRVRAELGPPAHEMAGNMNAPTLLFWMFGTSGVGAQNLTMMTMFWGYTGRGYRTHPMPCQLEAFKMGQAGRVDMRGLGWVMMLAMFVGALAVYWACLHLEYKHGRNIMTAHNFGIFRLLKSRIDNPQPTDWISLRAVGFGFMLTVGMMFARLRLPWWPFHPAGYALSMNFGVEYFWTCMIISSVLKWMILRYGGHRLNRKVMPFMYGLILGEFTVGAYWSVMSTVTGARTYDFAPG